MVKSLRTLVCLVGLLSGLSITGQAQSLITGNLPVSSVCPSGTLSVPFSATGPFGAGNTFTAQLSDGSGGFAGAVTPIGSITANPTSATTLTVQAIIPASIPISAVYKVRIVSSVGGRTSVSPSTLAIGTAAPATPVPQSFCQNSGTQNLTAVAGQNLQWYATANSVPVIGTGPTFPVSTTAAGSVYVTQTANGCESARTQVSYTITAPPAPPGVASITICQGQAASPLTAVFAPGATPNWYGTNATGGTASTNPPVPAQSTSYYVSQSIGGCESARVGLSVTVGPALPAPTVNIPAPYCANSTNYPVATASGTGLQWYNALGAPVGNSAPVPMIASVASYSYSVTQSSGNCVSPKTNYTITVNPKAAAPTLTTPPYCSDKVPASLLVTGTNLQWFTTAAGSTTVTQPVPPSATQTVYVQQTDANGCKSDITPLTVTVSAQPSVPAVTPSLTVCAGATASLIATALPGNTLRWYGSNPQGSFTTAPVATSVAGPQYVSQASSSGCESAKAQITVFVNALPIIPTATTPAPFCTGQAVGPLSATITTPGTTLRWYSDATITQFTTNAPTPSNQTSNAYYVAQADANGCVSSRVVVQVTVKRRPGVPLLSAAQSRINLCQTLAAQLLTASVTDGTSLNWYENNGANPLSGAPTPPTAGTGTITYQVAQVLAECEGPRATVTVAVNPIPVAPTVVPAGPYCQGAAVQPLSAVGQNLKWYGLNGAGGTATTTQIPDNTTIGPANYYVSQTVNGCESPRNSVLVQVKLTPGAPSTTPVEFCQNTPAPVLTAITSGNATLNWYGTGQNAQSTPTPPSVPNNTATTLTYFVSQSLDGCEGQKAQLAVRIKQKPGLPGTAPAAFCFGEATRPLTATGQTLTWFDQSDNSLGSSAMPNTGLVGTQVYKVSQTLESCVSDKAILTVTINPLPSAPATRNLQYCLPTEDQPLQSVGQLGAEGQNLKWYNPDGNRYDQTPTPPISQPAVITYQVTQTVNNCEGPKGTLQVSVQTTPAPVTPKPLVTYCRDAVATPLEATGTNLRWIDPNNTLLPANTTPTPPTLNATPSGGVFYQVYQTGSNGCVSPRTSINIVINTNPTLSLLGSTQVDLGQPAMLQLRFTGASPFSYTLSNGISGTARADTTVAITPRQTTTYQVAGVANVCGNGLPGNPASALITVRIPTITTGNLNSSTLCAGSVFTVPYATQGNFNLNLGYQVQLVSVTDTAGRNPVSLNATGVLANPVPIAIPAATPGGTYFVRVIRTVATSPLIQVVGSNSPTRLTVRALPTATLSGTQNLYLDQSTSLTVAFGGDGPWSFSFMDSTQTTTLSATVNPFLVSVQPLKTTTYRLTSVSNNCGTGVVSGTAVVTVLPVLGVDEDPLSNVVKAYPVPTATRLTVEIDRPLHTEPALLELVDLRGYTTLQQTTRSRQTDLDLSQQPAGLYILKVTVGDKQTTRNILKQ